MNNFARPGLGATELPPVNADDNGKVLGVSDGAWAKVAASGGSDLPDDPAQDGTYNLQNMVSSGTGTLSWASGSGGGVLVVTATNGTLDKTWTEIKNAMLSGGASIVQSDGGVVTVIGAYHDSAENKYYCVSGMVGDYAPAYRADSASDYPTASF